LTPELPGYGRSPATHPVGSLRESQDRLAEAMLALDAAELDIVGFSLGAWRALQLALGGRLRVGTIVSLGGFASLTEPHRAGLRALADAVEKLSDFSDPSFRALFASSMLEASFLASHPGEAAKVASWLDSTSPAMLAAELRSSASSEDLAPLLPSLRVRLFARVGERDAATPSAYSRQLTTAVPGAELQIVPGRGHALLNEDPAGTIAFVSDALSGRVT
jgi:pimeloyl-ACP methyl ester carboxylesterase